MKEHFIFFDLHELYNFCAKNGITSAHVVNVQINSEVPNTFGKLSQGAVDHDKEARHVLWGNRYIHLSDEPLWVHVKPSLVRFCDAQQSVSFSSKPLAHNVLTGLTKSVYRERQVTLLFEMLKSSLVYPFTIHQICLHCLPCLLVNRNICFTMIIVFSRIPCTDPLLVRSAKMTMTFCIRFGTPK